MRQVVVTGGGTGIGKAIATAFAKDGNVVVITGRRPEPLAAAVAELGSSVRAVRFDAADPAQVERALGELPETVDVLVNSAGATPTSAPRTRPRWPASQPPGGPISTPTCCQPYWSRRRCETG